MIARRLRLHWSLAAGSAAVGAAFYAVALAAAAERVTVENAWVPLAPPAIKVHAGYLTVVNRGDVEQSIVGAESPDYQRVELHASSVHNGLAEMGAVGEIVVPAGKSVAFEPGGLHVMLIGPKRTLAAADRVLVVLYLRGGAVLEASAVVRQREGRSPAEHHHHSGAR